MSTIPGTVDEHLDSEDRLEAGATMKAPTAEDAVDCTTLVAAETDDQLQAEEQIEEQLDPASERRLAMEQRCSHGLDWPVLFWLVAVHVGVLFAPFTFTWQALALAVVLHWLTGGIGICLGYHRLFTHGSFKTYRPIRWAIACVGTLAGEGSCVLWVANHRKHHALSDKPGDPHSPLDGPWWSHMFWFLPKVADYDGHNRRWAPDLMKEGFLRFMDRTFLLWHVAFAAALFAAGYAYAGTSMAWSFLVWGMFVRLTFVLHATWLVNSASHIWGYRNYETSDQSRNLWWVALFTYGEGWHNNHHAYPRMASYGHRWWEFDITFLTIRAMQKLGLAWDVAEYDREKLGTPA